MLYKRWYLSRNLSILIHSIWRQIIIWFFLPIRFLHPMYLSSILSFLRIRRMHLTLICHLLYHSKWYLLSSSLMSSISTLLHQFLATLPMYRIMSIKHIHSIWFIWLSLHHILHQLHNLKFNQILHQFITMHFRISTSSSKLILLYRWMSRKLYYS